MKIYNPQEKKLKPRTISGYFIGYAERSKGYIFYCPSHITRIVESRNAKFIENDLISGSDKFQNIVFEKVICAAKGISGINKIYTYFLLLP